MRALVIILTVMSFTRAQASFNRFWVGYKKSEIPVSSFISGLNEIFFDKTIDVGRGKGLVAYQPYITKMTGFVPDELALVNYENEARYRALRETDAGRAYSELHWDYFQKQKSKSTVTEAFAGVISPGHAYELHPQFERWQNGATHVNIYQVAPSEVQNIQNAFSALKFDRKIANSVLLLTEEYLLIEYRSYGAHEANPTSLPFRMLESATLTNGKLVGRSIGKSEGINFQF